MSDIERFFAEAMTDRAEGHPFLMHLMSQALEGHLCVDLSGDEELVKSADALGEVEGVIHHQGSYYLERNYLLETRIVEQLERLWKTPLKPRKELSIEGLNAKQKEAVEKATTSPLLFLSGGPGTGKTHTVKNIIRAHLGKENLRVVLTAPTGKAAGNLAASVKRDLPCEEKQIQTGTLHALLGLRPNKTSTDHVFDGDLIVVDECSMIDAALWAALLSAVPKHAHLILLGDSQQLPPIESGRLFEEMCHYAKECQKESYAHLEECMRIESRELLDFTQWVIRGDDVSALMHLQSGRAIDLVWIEEIECEEALVAEVLHHFPLPTYVKPENPLEKIEAFKILSPMRRGPLGIESMNRAIFHHFKQEVKDGMWWPIPMIITKNDARLGLSNGDVGVLLRHIAHSGDLERPFAGDDRVYFPHMEALPAAILPHFELAYALSIHKSQGSEYDEVALIIPEGTEKYGREAIYTGLTRAKKRVSIYSTEEILIACLKASFKRRSQIAKRLR